jgi:predicted peptidase
MKALIIALLFAINVNAQILKSYTNLVGDKNAYYEIPSDTYDKTKPAPVLIFMHGKDQKAWGENKVNTNVLNVGLPNLIRSGTVKFPGIFLVLQNQYSDWDNYFDYGRDSSSVRKPGAYVKNFIDEMKKVYNIDTTRIYLTGLSMGGGGCLSVVQNYPSLCAAAVPIAGWGDPAKTTNIKTAIWIIQGELDHGSTLKALGESFIRNNPTVQNHAPTIYAGVGHDAWTRGYAEPDFMPWLLSKKLTFGVPDVTADPVIETKYVLVNGVKTALPLKIEEAK